MRIVQRLQGLAGLIAIAAFLAGIPALLLAAGVVPWTTRWDRVIDRLPVADDGSLLVLLLGLVTWLGWAYFAVSLVAEAAARIRDVRLPQVRGFGLSQSAARRLFDVAALAFVALPSLASPTQALAPATPGVTVTQPLDPASTSSAPSSMTTTAAPATAPDAEPTAEPAESPQPHTVQHVVRRGDSLWRIAEHELGDGHRWSEIHALNRDVLGADPDVITPGTVLLMPHDSRPQVTTLGDGYVVVERGDTLSQIAEDELGDAARYPEIVAASRGITQPGGEHLTDPDLIKPGWVVDVSPGDPTSQPADDAALTSAVEADDPTPETNAAPAPVPVPAPAVPPGSEDLSAHDVSPTAPDDVEARPAWIVPGLVGAGSILGAGMFLTVRAHRRTRLRSRLPGHVIAPIPAELVATEETARAVGARVARPVQRLDVALQGLASSFLDPSCYPRIVAAELTTDRVRVHLAEDATLPAPWSGDGRTWSALLEAEHHQVEMIPPYPMLVSVGQDEDGALWLVNLEGLGTLTVTGAATDVEGFARHTAAELAVSAWSFLVDVHVVGLAGELDGFHSGRVRHSPAGDLTPLDNLAADVEAARDAPTWDPEDLTMVFIGPESTDHDTTQRLATAIGDHIARPGVAVVVLNPDSPLDGATDAEITADHRLRIPTLGIDVEAAILTADEARTTADLVAITDTHPNIPLPVHDDEADPLAALTDIGGAIRTEHVVDRSPDDEPASEKSLLPEPAQAYSADAAVTVDDVRVLAPVVPDETTAKVVDADPHLDRDYERWTKGRECPVPRLVLLGETTVHGLHPCATLSERRKHYAELAAFLWLHPDGVPSPRIGEAFTCTDGRARADVANLRTSFGERHVPRGPVRGQDKLPDPNGPRNWGGAHLVDVLVDFDLFRRLRARGLALGARDGTDNGLQYLLRALDLVQGEPFSDERPHAWFWMHESERIDHEITAAIVDTSLLVHARALHADPPDLDTARAAVQTALRASPYDEPARLALAAVEEASGNYAEAERLRRDDVLDRTDDYRAPLDPPARTRALVKRPRGK